MIQGLNISSPFAQCYCPAEGGMNICSKPYCPFLHHKANSQLHRDNIKKAKDDGRRLMMMETLQSKQYRELTNGIGQSQEDATIATGLSLESSGNGGTFSAEQPVVIQQEIMVNGMCAYPQPYPAENSTKTATQFDGVYFGYVAPTIELNTFSQPNSTTALLPSNPYAQTYAAPVVPNQPSHSDSGFRHEPMETHNQTTKRKKKTALPAYTPTPIAQLEREKEAREKRMKLAERQKRIQERLEQQKGEATKGRRTTGRNEPGESRSPVGDCPIDQILIEQEEFLADQELSRMELEKRRQREKLKEQVERSKKRKGFTASDDDTKTISEKMSAKSSSPGWICKNNAMKMMDDLGEEVATWKKKTQAGNGNKRKNNVGNETDDEEAKAAIKMIKVAREKRDSEETRAAIEASTRTLEEKPQTVIELIEEEQTRIKELANVTKKRKKDEKPREIEITSSKKHKGINNILKNVAQIDKTIEDLEKEIRQSKGNLVPLPTPSTSKSSVEPKKKTPVWRQPDKVKNALTNVLEENALNWANRKSSETIIDTLFGQDDEETATVKVPKKEKRPLWEVDNASGSGKKRKISNSSASDNEKRKKERAQKAKEEDETTRREHQELVDLISDDDDKEICILAVKTSKETVKNVEKRGSLRKNADEKPKTSTSSLQKSAIKTNAGMQSSSSSFSNPANFADRPFSPTNSMDSSVSIVPATPSPQSSPQPNHPTLNRLPIQGQGTNKRQIIPSAQEELHNRTLKAMLKIANDEKSEKKLSKDSQIISKKGVTFQTNQSAPPIQEKSQTLKTQLVPTSSPSPHSTPSSSTNAPDMKKPPKIPQFTQQTLASSLKKGEQRKAHAPNFQISDKAKRQLIPLEPTNRKVALQVRQARLALIHAEYVKICSNDPDMAVESAQHEEKAILDKCTGRLGYIAAIPNVIKRLREFLTRNDGGRLCKNSVSHQNVLLGRHADSVTLGLHRAQRVAQHKAAHLSESDLYEALMRDYVLAEEQLWANGYPRWMEVDEGHVEEENEVDAATTGYLHEARKSKGRSVEIRQSELDRSKGRSQPPFLPDSELKRICARCGAEYRLTKTGDYAPGASSDECIYHWGRAWKKRLQGAQETRYTCCQSSLDVRGCAVAGRHITQTLRMSTLQQYVDTPRPFGVGDPRSRKVYALDCEMVYCVWGPEVARISMVDILGEEVLDVLVRPEVLLIDCNTKFSGLSAQDVLNAQCNLQQARERLFELVNSETILIGHSLESDLRALRIVHPRVVDTSVVFPHRLGPPQKRALKTLAAEILQLIIQEDENGHDSKEDALACMRIMLRKVRGAE